MCPLPRLLLCCVLSAPGLVLAAAPSHDTRDASLITAADVLKINQLGSPEFSPDGKWIVYTVKSVVAKPGAAGEFDYRTQLWLAATDGTTPPRELTHASQPAGSAQWSPDGRQIAFVRGEKGKAQLCLLPFAEGGEAFQITKLETSVSVPRWSPDGRRIAFTTNLGASEVRGALEKQSASALLPGWDSERPNRKHGDTTDWRQKSKDGAKTPAPPLAKADGTLTERRDWLARNEADANPRVTHRLNFLGESDLETDSAFANLYVIEPRESAEPMALAPDYESLGTPPGGAGDGGSAPGWSADSKWIYIAGRLTEGQAEHPDRLRANDLIRVSADGKKRETLHVLPTHAKSFPVTSPDGHSVAFLASALDQEGYAQTGIGVWTDDGRPARLLETQLDRSAAQLRWSGDGAAVWFTAPSQGDFVLYRTSTKAGAAEAFSARESGVTAFDVTGDRVAYVRTSPENPSELIVSPQNRHDPRTLTTHNSAWLEGKKIARMEHRTLERTDGAKLDAWLIRPANFDATKKYPLLLEIHGGPSAMWGPGEPSMWHEFQFFAARGFAIVFCNPRGSGGYGYAFQHLNYQNWGPGPGADVLAAVDLACAENWVDASRAVVAGGSYGGYLTAWVISQDHSSRRRWPSAGCTTSRRFSAKETPGGSSRGTLVATRGSRKRERCSTPTRPFCASTPSRPRC